MPKEREPRFKGTFAQIDDHLAMLVFGPDCLRSNQTISDLHAEMQSKFTQDTINRMCTFRWPEGETQIPSLSEDWYTTLMLLYAWCELYEVEPNEAVYEHLPMDVWTNLIHMLKEEKLDPKVVRALGHALLHTPELDGIDIPDELWRPFERLYDDLDPNYDNQNMN